MPANDRLITGFIKRGANFREADIEFAFKTHEQNDGVVVQLTMGFFPSLEAADTFVAKAIEQMQGQYSGGTVMADSSSSVVGEKPSPQPARKAAAKKTKK